MHIVDVCLKCNTELENIEISTNPPSYILRCPKCGFYKVVKPALEEDGQDKKPPLGVRPMDDAAWNRIAELAYGIIRQYEGVDFGDTKVVSRWANEITWQCSIIESMKEDE